MNDVAEQVHLDSKKVHDFGLKIVHLDECISTLKDTINEVTKGIQEFKQVGYLDGKLVMKDTPLPFASDASIEKFLKKDEGFKWRRSALGSYIKMFIDKKTYRTVASSLTQALFSFEFRAKHLSRRFRC